MFDKSKDYVVLVADAMDYNGSELEVFDRIIDMPHKYYVDELSNAIIANRYQLVKYDSPKHFSDNIEKHRDDLVLPYWFGKDSRNRHGLVPAMCEGLGIKYVGGDAYTKIVCNDKQLAKLLCRNFGLRTPESLIISSIDDLQLLADFPIPYVVKPMYEGTSLGISDRNLIHDEKAGPILIRELLMEFKTPLIVETFVPGKEVSICFLGYKEHISLWSAAERIVSDDVNYFHHRLYTFEEKKTNENLGFRTISNEIDLATYQSCAKIFQYLDKVEFMRIDGRLNNGEFHLIELSPETHLGSDAEFCGPLMMEHELSFTKIIDLILSNSLKHYQSQNASN
jgi:D-alanine-D-alanine ligase